MSADQHFSHRINFFELLHHQFLYLKGYGTYAYITPQDVDQLYTSYLMHQSSLIPSLNQQEDEIRFIRFFIKSL